MPVVDVVVGVVLIFVYCPPIQWDCPPNAGHGTQINTSNHAASSANNQPVATLWLAGRPGVVPCGRFGFGCVRLACRMHAKGNTKRSLPLCVALKSANLARLMIFRPQVAARISLVAIMSTSPIVSYTNLDFVRSREASSVPTGVCVSGANDGLRRTPREGLQVGRGLHTGRLITSPRRAGKGEQGGLEDVADLPMMRNGK